MATNLPTAEENFCEICNSAYTSPRLLDCFHIFCTTCLEKLIEGKQIFRCPLCRRDLPVPIEGIKSVPFIPYTTKSNSVKKNETERTCEMCDEIEIYSRCIDCDQNMCKSCHDYHLRNKTLRKHTLVEENTELPTKQDKIRPEDMQCGEHVKEFSFYCKSCNSLICKDCKESKHFLHKTEYIDSAVKDMNLSLTSVVTSLNSKIPFLSNTIENAKTEKKEIPDTYRHNKN
ncbi:unnamed protein product [Mytilus edulis]|uniref:TRIM56 n=1 Tax=Mytilus edulis TaxID=6550 RepID=A0A8S3V541_MYTED|nr:unnamed protein product [Mytilus edulis]